MSAEIEQACGEKPELIPGSGGIFDVIENGDMLFSKFTTGRFPEPGEIAKQIRS